jgi:hypothetical protein
VHGWWRQGCIGSGLPASVGWSQRRAERRALQTTQPAVRAREVPGALLPEASSAGEGRAAYVVRDGSGAQYLAKLRPPGDCRIEWLSLDFSRPHSLGSRSAKCGTTRSTSTQAIPTKRPRWRPLAWPAGAGAGRRRHVPGDPPPTSARCPGTPGAVRARGSHEEPAPVIPLRETGQIQQGAAIKPDCQPIGRAAA